MIEILERGDVLFMVRPPVQPADAPSVVPGVQRFFLVLSPAGRHLHRRVRVGKKRMPPPGARFWARIEKVGTLQQVLAGQIDEEWYRTRTRGERYQPGARLIAQGCYAVVRHGDHCHLAYRVETRGDDSLPPSPAGGRTRPPAGADGDGHGRGEHDDERDDDRDDDDDQLGPGEEDERGDEASGDARTVASADGLVPDAGSPLLLFEGHGKSGAIWSTGGRPTLLDREGAELVLVGAGDDPEGTLGVDLLPVSTGGQTPG